MARTIARVRAVTMARTIARVRAASRAGTRLGLGQ